MQEMFSKESAINYKKFNIYGEYVEHFLLQSEMIYSKSESGILRQNDCLCFIICDEIIEKCLVRNIFGEILYIKL